MPAEAVGPLNTIGQVNWPPLILIILAAELIIWSIATSEKLKVINSTMGRKPFIAAPTAIPVKPSSAIGVSMILFSPNSASIPLLTLYAPLYSATSSPIRNTFSSLRISSFKASRSASLNSSVLIVFVFIEAQM